MLAIDMRYYIKMNLLCILINNIDYYSLNDQKSINVSDCNI